MIDHLSLPVSDYARSRAFYDKVLGTLGYKVAMEITDSPAYIGAGYGDSGSGHAEPTFWIGAGRTPGPRPASPDGQHLAGIVSERGNVLGMMPHPERAISTELGSDDGASILRAALGCVAARVRPAALITICEELRSCVVTRR